MASLSFEFKIPREGLTGPHADEIVADETIAAMEESVSLAVLHIAPLTPINTGSTRASIQTKLTGREQNLVGRVFSPLQHAVVVEEGSSKRWWPPIEPLIRWARAKFGAGSATEIAHRVRYAISRRGLKGHHMFRRGWKRAEPAVRATWDRALERMRDRLAGGGR